jgi:hypothetical protein
VASKKKIVVTEDVIKDVLNSGTSLMTWSHILSVASPARRDMTSFFDLKVSPPRSEREY